MEVQGSATRRSWTESQSSFRSQSSFTAAFVLEREYGLRGYELVRAVWGRNQNLWDRKSAATLDPRKPRARVASLVFAKTVRRPPDDREPFAG